MPPPPHSRRAYIDSDDEEIRKSPPTKQRKVCESDEESSEDVGRQHPTGRIFYIGFLIILFQHQKLRRLDGQIPEFLENMSKRIKTK